jgi:hypothetical protein
MRTSSKKAHRQAERLPTMKKPRSLAQPRIVVVGAFIRS